MLIHIICHEVFHLVSLLVSRAVRGLAVPASRHRPSSCPASSVWQTTPASRHDATMKNKKLSGIRLSSLLRCIYFFIFHPSTVSTMSDSEQYHIETADAGASDTIPCEAGQIKKGG
jgi:hypothetical protein